jgi:hypothetical protein
MNTRAVSALVAIGSLLVVSSAEGAPQAARLDPLDTALDTAVEAPLAVLPTSQLAIPAFPTLPPRPVEVDKQLPWPTVIGSGLRLAPLAGKSPSKAHRRAFAELLFAEASAHFVAERYHQALDAYVLATRFWDHPSLRLGVAETLINLDRSAEAYQHLAVALGEQREPRRKRRRALRYMQRLRRSRGVVDLSCHHGKARVLVNGRLVLSGLDRAQLVLGAGVHNVLIQRSGRRPEGLQIRLEPGATLRLVLR